VRIAREPEWDPNVRYPDAAQASFGITSTLEVVFGRDDRQQASETKANPWRQIAALRIAAKDSNFFVGTAWFIGPRTLATAGHCIFLHKAGGFPIYIDVIPGKKGTEDPFGKIRAKDFRVVDGWKDLKRRDMDYGVIQLPDDTLGKRLGWFNVDVLNDADLVNTEVTISGYPADRDNADRQYFHKRVLEAVRPNRLEYQHDTFGGQSGSPIWKEVSPGKRVAVGVHTNGGATSNSGTRINEAVMDNLIQWVEEN
jgi:glutamyl endopeptidase